MSYFNPTPLEWMDNIADGLEYRRQYGLEEHWSELEAIYYNVHQSMMNDGPNIFLSQGDAMLAQVTSPNPRVGIEPRTPGSVQRAPILESLDNSIMEDLRITEAVDTANLHAYIFGRGVLKIGYDSEFGYDPTKDLGGPLRLGMTTTQLNKAGTRRIEYNATVQPGMPWVRAVMPHDIILPWGVMEIRDAPWIAHRVVRHIEDLKADVKYENTRKLLPRMSRQDFSDTYRSPLKLYTKPGHTDAEWVEFYEIMDRRTGKIFAVVPDYEKYIRNDANSLQINNELPYTSIAFTPRTRAFWTTPDAFYLLHIQNELSDTAIQRTKQRRLSVLKLMYDQGTIDESELDKLSSPEIGAAIKINAGRDIDKAVKPFQVSPNLFLIQEEELLRANAREQIGFSRNQVGEFSSGRKTATEAANVQRSSQLRMSRRGLRVQTLYTDTIKIVNEVIFKHWTFPRYVEVLGQKRGQEWQQFRGSDLRGKYSYKVDLVDESFERQMKLEAIQIYAMFSQDPSVNPQELQQYLLGTVNDPAFARIFDADVRRQMQQLPEGGGGATRNGSTASAQPVLQSRGF